GLVARGRPDRSAGLVGSVGLFRGVGLVGVARVGGGGADGLHGVDGRGFVRARGEHRVARAFGFGARLGRNDDAVVFEAFGAFEGEPAVAALVALEFAEPQYAPAAQGPDDVGARAGRDGARVWEAERRHANTTAALARLDCEPARGTRRERAESYVNAPAVILSS